MGLGRSMINSPSLSIRDRDGIGSWGETETIIEMRSARFERVAASAAVLSSTEGHVGGGLKTFRVGCMVADPMAGEHGARSRAEVPRAGAAESDGGGERGHAETLDGLADVGEICVGGRQPVLHVSYADDGARNLLIVRGLSGDTTLIGLLHHRWRPRRHCWEPATKTQDGEERERMNTCSDSFEGQSSDDN